MNIRHFAQFPKPYLAYPKIIKGLVFKKQTAKKVLPKAEYIVDSFQVNQDHLKAYNDVCGFENNGYIPAIYLAVQSQSLQMHMMAKEAFPFAILGLVHIRNQVTQYRNIGTNETLTLSCKFGDLEPHDKGLQFDFITVAKVGNEVVMEGLTTYLSRQKMTESSVNKKSEVLESDFKNVADWYVSENTGRRYALVSGDFNLIHIHAVTAKAFGFKQAIAHGMWSNAKALSSLALPEKYKADVFFRLPIFLPSDIQFLKAEEADVTHILIQSLKNKKPHMVGEIIKL
ncbi:MaoC family dehydratase [Acinetobacter equi]|uniref:Dehydratase n=1 Tax=Acinetobacter equi TaxID=1324350 RepID=A0A0N9VF59_9GAMM|nr:MaoC/PaaZ C-terminal domain-containing protein [Acinetobacter equi]ALH95922.1 dehydratase [Acinetobacter equi]